VTRRVLLAILCLGLLATSSAAAPRPGAEVTLRAVGSHVTGAQLNRAVAIMRTRLARLGAHGSVVHTAGSPTVTLRLAGPASVTSSQAKAIGERGTIRFYDLAPSLLTPMPSTSLAAAQQRARAAGPGKAVIVTCDSSVAIVCPGPNGAMQPVRGARYYVFKDDPALGASDLEPGGAQFARDPVTRLPIVSITLTHDGDLRFHALTRAVAQRGAATDEMQDFAIVVDGQLRSMPGIDYTHYPDGIDPSGTGAEINGFESAPDARDLAVVLQTGRLPVGFTVVSTHAVR
jgi:preprotein translocase subunit SecD